MLETTLSGAILRTAARASAAPCEAAALIYDRNVIVHFNRIGPMPFIRLSKVEILALEIIHRHNMTLSDPPPAKDGTTKLTASRDINYLKAGKGRDTVCNLWRILCIYCV